MIGIEKAIRSALAKGDAEDRKFRERVYLSALSAFERSLKQAPELDQLAIQERKAALHAVIRDIETEFLPAVSTPSGDDRPAPPPVEPSPAPVSPQPAGTDDDFVAHIKPDRPFQVEDGSLPPASGSGRRFHPFILTFIAALCIALIGVVLWWFVQTGLFLSEEERDGSVPNPPPQLAEDSFKPSRSDQETDIPSESEIDWLTIFTTDDPATAVAPAGMDLTVEDDNGTVALRARPSSPDSVVLFDVGQGILEQMAGKEVTFAITARSVSEGSTQISVRCSFPELGDCGRKRYDVGPSSEDYLFKLKLPEGSPSSAGAIALTPDISEGRKAIFVYGIKVAIPR